MKMMKAMIDERNIIPEDLENDVDTDSIIKQLNKIFTFCLIWTVGGIVDGEGRERLHIFLKKVFANNA